MPPPNQIPKPQFPGMDPVFQQHYQQMIDAVNSVMGHNGTVEFANHVSLGGNRIMNVGTPVDDTDALPSGTAAKSYSAAALRPQLESGGSQPMRTMRRLNDQNQREQVSSFLNDIPSSVPNANQVFPTVTPSGGGVSVSIPPANFSFADGSTTQLNGRTDLLTLPSQYAIANIVLSGDTVTITTATPTGLTAGQVATIVGVDPAIYNGTFYITGAVPPNTLVLQNPAASGMYVTGGFVQVNEVYYYCVAKRSQDLILVGSFTSDTASNRLEVNRDGLQIVAVVTLTNSGGQVSSSGGGGTPIVGSPTAGSFF